MDPIARLARRTGLTLHALADRLGVSEPTMREARRALARKRPDQMPPRVQLALARLISWHSAQRWGEGLDDGRIEDRLVRALSRGEHR